MIPAGIWAEMVAHCRRKLAGIYADGEARERKAFGGLTGLRSGDSATVTRCIPFRKNLRGCAPYDRIMDGLMAKHAVLSETPLGQRGWVADPDELRAIAAACRESGWALLGTYHMHRVGWPDDPLRDRPTTLDTILGGKSRMLMFIISMVQPATPRIRAFFEGNINLEVPITITPEGPAGGAAE